MKWTLPFKYSSAWLLLIMMVDGKKKAFHNVYYTAFYQNPAAKRQTCPVESLECRLDGIVGHSWGKKKKKQC